MDVRQKALPVDRAAVVGASGALLGSAVVHATVIGEHFREWAPAGMFFLALQLLETALAVAVWMSARRAVALAVVVSGLVTVGVWAVSRTAGLPFGPADFQQPESMGVQDLACCALELLAAGLLLPRALGRTPATGSVRGMARVRVAVVVVLVAAVTGWGLSPALAGGDHHRAASEHRA